MKRKYWLIGIAVGLLTGLTVAGIATYLDWRVNPGGLYHGADGTHWDIVGDTAMSWLVPVTGYVTLIAWAVLFAISRWRR